MDEFGFIAKHLSVLAGPEGLDLKDDVAVWPAPKGLDIVMNMDTLIEGIHFPDGKFDAQIAEKLIRVNISDLVAKGADPSGYLLSLALSKKVEEANLEEFCQGLVDAQQRYGISLWGGDTTRVSGKNVLTVTLIGTVPKGKSVLRSGANPGDLVCVSGHIGDSYLGLKLLLNQIHASDYQSTYLKNIYHMPEPPFALRTAIRKFATAALDISDGLLADAAHLASASHVGIDIFLTTIPLSIESTKWVLGERDHLKARLKLAAGGDDYQVLLTLPENKFAALKRQAIRANISLTVIGKITKRLGVRCLDSQGNEVVVDKAGYKHF